MAPVNVFGKSTFKRRLQNASSPAECNGVRCGWQNLPYLKNLAEERCDAKKKKDFKKADELRARILGLGFVVSDGVDTTHQSGIVCQFIERNKLGRTFFVIEQAGPRW